MKKVTLLVLVSILLLLAFTACKKKTDSRDNGPDEPKVEDNQVQECAHEWLDATCTAAKTCKLCQATDGSPLKHQTVAPTCTTPEMCSVCGFASEYWKPALGHDWIEASCLKGTAKTCRTCGVTEGGIPEHIWTEATCLGDSYCEVCNLVDKGTALGHDPVIIDPVAPTCTATGLTSGEQCSRCGYVEEGKGPQPVPALEHKGYEVEIPGKDASCEEAGYTPGKKCSLCGTITETQLIIDAKGHQRYEYDEEGNVIADGYVKTEYPINPATGLPFKACESDGTTTYNCLTCGGSVETSEAKVHHSYPDGATCSDFDAVCEYCSKMIDHEFADPTCEESAKCIICGSYDYDRPPLGHKDSMTVATCMAPSTCTLCGYTEGAKLLHELTYSVASGVVTYSCKTCESSFTPLDEYYYLDGSDHNYIVPVNNRVGGYETALDIDGKATDMPAIKTDARGNKYYSLIKISEPETNPADGKQYPPQTQLWVPMQRSGFTGFNADNAAVGFMSFRINAFMDKNFNVSFLEGTSGWSSDAAISNVFNIMPPTTDEETQQTIIRITGLDDGNEETPELVLFEKDITSITDVADKFTGWLDVYIGIVLDDATDTLNLHYYINGIYKGSVITPLLTAGNGIKCAYFSGNALTIGGGLMLDDIAFGYTQVGNWPFDTSHEHSYTIVADEVAPTCTNDGYRIYACECGSIGGRAILPALGHIEKRVSGVAADCTNDGHSAYSYCSREGCGVEIVKKEIIAATGHNYKTLADRPATCTTSGGLVQLCQTCGYRNEEQRPTLGHEYSLSSDCSLGGTCTRCGFVNTLPIGHVFGEPTCTAPATCLRDGCTATTGDALGHDIADPTCTTPPTCTRCGHVDGEKLSHTIAHKYVQSTLVYYCTGCSATYNISVGYYLNGTTLSDMTGNANNKINYTVTSGTDLPKLVDGHYELINTTGNSGQIQLWVPVNDNSANFGFSAANSAVGFFSFKMNASIDGTYGSAANQITIKLVDGMSNNNSDRWSSQGVLGDMILHSINNGAMTLGYKPSGSDKETKIYDFAVGEDNFSGWVDVKVGMEFNPVSDQVTYHFYINGEYILSLSATNTTKSNSINCVYISGYTMSKGSGLMFDDIAFGYTVGGTWVFDSCAHKNATTKVYAPTCTKDGYNELICSECGYVGFSDYVDAIGHIEGDAATCTNGIKCARPECGEYYGDPLGHTGGTATCTNKAVCSRCGKEYGSPAHDMVNATCSAAAYCKACSQVFGEKVSHNPQVKVDGNKVIYYCKYCEKSYKLDNAYYHDVELSVGKISPADENSKYNGVSTENGYYEFIHNDTSDNGKAVIWIPDGNGGTTNFEGFSTTRNAVGVVSLSVNAYMSGGLNMQLVDTDLRSGGDQNHLLGQSGLDFWKGGAMPNFIMISAPDKNVVTISGWNGTLKKITVSDEDQYTGWIDITVGIKLSSSGDVTLYYYIDGEYIGEATKTMNILTNKIDGLYINGSSNVPGSGYKVDNIGFGYATPSASNPAPEKP